MLQVVLKAGRLKGAIFSYCEIRNQKIYVFKHGKQCFCMTIIFAVVAQWLLCHYDVPNYSISPSVRRRREL